MPSRRGYWLEPSGDPVPYSEAISTWADHAHDILMGVARRYHAIITYKELAETVQERSGIRTTALLHNWIGAMLSVVVHEGHRRGEPPLTALVVHVDDGMVGTGYAEVLQVAGEPPLHDDMERERHAAASRLRCYRRFARDLPADGGAPALAPRLDSAVRRRRERLSPTAKAAVCPRCFIQMPATNVCDECGYDLPA
jgi:hypothetical protein